MITAAINHPDNTHANHLRNAFQMHLPRHNIVIWDDTVAAEYLITWKPNLMAFKMPKLKIIFALGAGVDAFLNNDEIPGHVQIVRLEEAGMGEQMLEFALYAALHYSRDMVAFNQAQFKKEWLGRSSPKLNPFSSKIGIMGLGQLGGYVAKRLVEFGYPVSGYSHSLKEIDGVSCYTCGQLNTFLAQSEVLINLLPLTDQTKDILNSELFKQLPHGAYLVNIARGGHLNEDDLIPALDSGQLQGALLDVFKTEPLPQDHLFWGDQRITITPHLAAITTETEALQQITDNIASHEAGRIMTGLIDRAKGY